MGNNVWSEITKEEVVIAIEKFISGCDEYPEPKSTFLLYNNKKLPAKHIRGMAYEVHYKVPISKSEYAGGMETVRFFKRLGFEIVYTGPSKLPDTKPAKNVDVDSKSTTRVHQKVSIIKKSESKSSKISISSKNVIEQKNALQLILNKKFDGDIVCEKTYPWLKTPEIIDGEYIDLYNALSSYRGDTSFAKKNVVLRCDFVCESKKLIIEYDERQHFTEARKIALESYKNIGVCFDRDKWIKACSDIQAKDNSPKNRDEVRAYYDSTRDIECAKHGYKLVRIMHGQIDFEKENAVAELEKILPKKDVSFCSDEKTLKVCMYLQTSEYKNKSSFDSDIDRIKTSNVDLVVFPEHCYIPGIEKVWQSDISDEKDQEYFYTLCLNLSRELNAAVVVSSCDRYNSIFSLYANINATKMETITRIYYKHTMTGFSAFDFEDYSEFAPEMFKPIFLKEFKVGMTICYDCNHAIFSRMYSLSGGIDLLVNSTGGNVIYDKWYKYNKVRAIENSCSNLVTMGGDTTVAKAKNYVFGFNPNGGEIDCIELKSSSEERNIPGGLYVYNITKQSGNAQIDVSNAVKTENKNVHLEISAGNINELIRKSELIKPGVYRYKTDNENIIFCCVDGLDIMKPEKVLSLLYTSELRKYWDKRYIIVNKHNHLDEAFYETKLSTILKVRAMENFCAVILESDNINACYQTGMNRTAQMVLEKNGNYGIDLSRTTGPFAIWKNKNGMREDWRKGFEWLVDFSNDLSESQ